MWSCQEVKIFLQEVFLLWQEVIRLCQEVNFFTASIPFDIGSHVVMSGSKNFSARNVPFMWESIWSRQEVVFSTGSLLRLRKPFSHDWKLKISCRKCSFCGRK